MGRREICSAFWTEGMQADSLPITYPAPEGTSNGLLLLMGQISGILFILGMDSLKDPTSGSMTTSLLLLVGLLVVAVLLSTRLKESTLLSQ